MVGACAILWASYCYAAPDYPDIPSRELPTILKLPANDELILDVRTAVLSGDPIPPPEARNSISSDSIAIEVGVYDLSSKSEMLWNLLPGVPLRLYFSSCCAMRASWATRKGKLFLALKDAAYLVDPSGNHSKLTLRMPGVSIAYRDASEFAVSADAAHLLFRLVARDDGDKYVDPVDPHAATGGRLYQDIMAEDIDGSMPRSVARANYVEHVNENVSTPAWSSNRKRIAYSRRAGKALELVVASSDAGQIIWRVPIDVQALLTSALITEVRWSPDDTKLGFVVYEGTPGSWESKQRTQLFMIDADGQHLTAMKFDDKSLNVSSFAWSPTGKKLAFRSDFEAPRLCNHQDPMFVAQAGFEPCRVSENLFISNVDGSRLDKVSNEPQFRAGQLFWIR